MTLRTLFVAVAVLVPTAAAADPGDTAPAAPVIKVRAPALYSFGARVGGYGFRRNAGDSRSDWNECRMNGLGLFGERRFGRHLFIETGLDFYFSETFPMQPVQGDLPIDRMSGLVTAAAGLRAAATSRISGYAQIGGGLELTKVSVPYDTGSIKDKLALPVGFIGIGGDIRIGSKTFFGANFRVHMMGNFDYDPKKLEMQSGWTVPPSASEVFDPSTDIAAQGQFYVRRDL